MDENVAPPGASASGITFGDEQREEYLNAADKIEHPRNLSGRPIIRPVFGIDQGMKFLDLQARAGSAARDPTIANFKTLLQYYLGTTGQLGERGYELNSKTLRIIIQQGIINKIEGLKKKNAKYTEGLNTKIKYFASERFLNALLTPIPKKESLITTKVIKTSYTDWLNTLLDAKFQDWRDEALAPIDNTVQCISAGAGGILKKGSIRNYQDNNNIICYLCNRSTKGAALKTMECEHILPVICALSHWWLIKNPPETDEELQELLGREYDWAHRCCNQIKSNLEFINLRSGNEYAPDRPRIKMLLRRIADSPLYDCRAITPAILPATKDTFVETMTNRIIKTKIEPILQVINQNIVEFDDYGLYEIFTKLKILSAIEDDTFLKVMIGSGEPTVTVPKKKGAAIKAAFRKGAFTGGGEDEYYELSVPMLNMMASFFTGGEITDYTLLGNIEDVDYLIAAYIQFNPDFFIQQDEYPELARMYTILADIPSDVPEQHMNTRTLITAGVGGATRYKNQKSKSKRRTSSRRNSNRKRRTSNKK